MSGRRARDGRAPRPRRSTALLVACLAVLPSVTDLSAQGPAVDNAVARARALVEAGDGRAGRLVLDSLVREAGVATPALGELLYWRGLLAESSADAERDWRRLLVEVPMSPRSEDALLRLAQLAQLRGGPAESRVHLERLVRDYPAPASQARAHFWLAKAYFAEDDRARACGALDIVRQRVPDNAVELRAQADDLRSRCRGVTAVAPLAPSAAAVAPATTAPATTAPAATTPATTTPATIAPAVTAPAVTAPAAAGRADTSPSARPARARYSVQLAALATAAQADEVAQRFRSRGIDVRIDGTTAPFRVRTGYFATRAQANARLAELKARGLDGFIAELTP